MSRRLAVLPKAGLPVLPERPRVAPSMIRTLLPRILAVALLGGALTVAGCDSSDDDAPTGVILGPAQTLGNGTVRSFVDLDTDGQPVALGVRLTESALTSLPQHAEHGAQETVLALPAEAPVAPYNHVSVDWNPAGHEPPGVYDVPHFDVHFYLMSETERDAINPALPDFDAMASTAPAVQHIPAGYVPTPGAVPRMGAHWVDPTSPEFTGEGFSRTFLYGFWDGRMNFLEPMVTKAYIESIKQTPTQTISFSIPQPPAFEKAGFYPGRYTIRYNADTQTYDIVLEGLERS